MMPMMPAGLSEPRAGEPELEPAKLPAPRVAGAGSFRPYRETPFEEII